MTDEPLHLVHRDVSPDNILIGRSGAVKLVDFGIAKARGQSHHTQAGTVKGKVAYMAPEQLRGEPLDRRVDLYALGVVLYELCTGRMPFEASSDASMVRAVLYDAAIPAVQRVPALPGPLQRILDQLLAKDREARYPDCRTLHADLEAFIRSTGEATDGLRPVTAGGPSRPGGGANPTAPANGATASAFAPTSPILLSERAQERAGVAPAAAMEILELDRTMRSDTRHPPAPVGSTMDLKPAEPPRRGRGSSAFVFPTALDAERASAGSVPFGLDRVEPRTLTDRKAARSRERAQRRACARTGRRAPGPRGRRCLPRPRRRTPEGSARPDGVARAGDAGGHTGGRGHRPCRRGACVAPRRGSAECSGRHEAACAPGACPVAPDRRRLTRAGRRRAGPGPGQRRDCPPRGVRARRFTDDPVRTGRPAAGCPCSGEAVRTARGTWRPAEQRLRHGSTHRTRTRHDQPSQQLSDRRGRGRASGRARDRPREAPRCVRRARGLQGFHGQASRALRASACGWAAR